MRAERHNDGSLTRDPKEGRLTGLVNRNGMDKQINSSFSLDSWSCLFSIDVQGRKNTTVSVLLCLTVRVCDVMYTAGGYVRKWDKSVKDAMSQLLLFVPVFLLMRF